MPKHDDQRLEKLYRRLRKHITNLSGAQHRKLWTWPRIPGQVVHQAAAQFAHDADPRSTIAFCDTTRLQTARAGFLITGAAFYCRATGGVAKSFRFSDLESCQSREVDGEPAIVVGAAQEEVVFTARDVELDAFERFVGAAMKARDAGLTDDAIRFMAVQELDEPTRSLYVRTLVAGLTDGEDGRAVDARELVELQMLMTRTACPASVRADVCDHLVSGDDTVERCLAELTPAVAGGTERAVKLSLLSDLACISSATAEGPVSKLPAMLGFTQECGLLDGEVALVIEASTIDLALAEEAGDELGERATQLAERAFALDLPLAAAFLSGSPLGLSARDIALAVAARGQARFLGVAALTDGAGHLLLTTGERHGHVGEDSPGAVAADVRHAVAWARRKTLDNIVVDLGHLTATVTAVVGAKRLDRRRLGKVAAVAELYRQALAVMLDEFDRPE